MMRKRTRTLVLFLVGGILLSALGWLLSPAEAAALDAVERPKPGVPDLERNHRQETLSGIRTFLTVGQMLIVGGAIKLFTQLFDHRRR